MTERTNYQEEATLLAEQGWAVIPLAPREKKPLITGWQKRGTNDPGQIARWWQGHPRANIGIACGPSGLVVIDLDVKNGVNGLDAWNELCRKLGFPPESSRMAQTASGGRHLFYTAPLDIDVRNNASTLGAGIDVRGNGGYVVAPPSVTPKGSYVWLAEGDPPLLPDALVELLAPRAQLDVHYGPAAGTRDHSAYLRAAVENEAKKVESAPQGERNDTLNKAAFSLGQLVSSPRTDLDRAVVEDRLLQAARACGLLDDEATRTIASGLGDGISQPRPEPHRQEQIPVSVEGSITEERSTDLHFLVSQSADDEGNAQCVKQLYGDRFLYCDAYGWMHYNDRFWDTGLAQADLTRAIVDTLKRRRSAAVEAEKESVVRAARPSAANIRNCEYVLKSLLTVSVDVFDSSPDLLNCQNGVLDLRSGQLVLHVPAQRFTYCIPVGYDPNATSRSWQEFLLEATGRRQEMVDYLQMAVGYSLTGHTTEECLFYLYGPTRSGKGTFTETLLHLLGRKPLATGVDFGTFTRRRDQDAQNFDLAPLKPCRLVIASESSVHDPLNAAKIKQLTGGDEVMCAFKHRDHFTYRPQFKIWLTSNHQVNADVDDDAVWYRLRVIEFPHSHAGHEDKSLKERMRSPENLSGILAWAVAGAVKWYQSGSRGLGVPRPVLEAVNAARRELDYVAQWVDECIERTDDPAHFLSNDVLYSSYQAWCIDNGVTPEKQRGLTKALKRKGHQAGKSRKYPDGKTRRGCAGVELRS